MSGRSCVPRDAGAPDGRPIALCPVACLCFSGSVRKANTRACMSESAGIEVAMRRLTLRLEDRCAEELSCTQFIQDVVGFTQWKRRRLRPYSRAWGDLQEIQPVLACEIGKRYQLPF